MLELPEIVCLKKQMQETLIGREIEDVSLLRSEKLERWGFVTQTEDEFLQKLTGKSITAVESMVYYLFLHTDSSYTLVIGEFDGTILFHRDIASFPKTVYLKLAFSDGTFLTTTVKLWGMMKVFDAEEHRQHVEGVGSKGREPTSEDFTLEYFDGFVAADGQIGKLNVKKLITSGVCASGLGNGYLQEILFRSRLHPRRKLRSLSAEERIAFHESIIDVVKEGISRGGRNTERDLFGRPGAFVSRLSKDTVGTPCTVCGSVIEKFHFEGGACYICPSCQSV